MSVTAWYNPEIELVKETIPAAMVYFSHMTLFLLTHHYSLTNYDWKILIWNFHFTADGRGMQKVKTLAPTCNGLASLQDPRFFMRWKSRIILKAVKGRSVGTWCDFIFKHDLVVKRNCWMMQWFQRSKAVSHTQCKTVTNLCRINLLAFKWWPFQIRRHGQINPQNAFSWTSSISAEDYYSPWSQRSVTRPFLSFRISGFQGLSDDSRPCFASVHFEINYSTEGGFRLLRLKTLIAKFPMPGKIYSRIRHVHSKQCKVFFPCF